MLVLKNEAMPLQISYNTVFSEAWIFLILCLYANLIYIKLRIQCCTVHPIESNIESNSTMAGMSAFLHIRTV